MKDSSFMKIKVYSNTYKDKKESRGKRKSQSNNRRNLMVVNGKIKSLNLKALNYITIKLTLEKVLIILKVSDSQNTHQYNRDPLKNRRSHK